MLADILCTDRASHCALAADSELARAGMIVLADRNFAAATWIAALAATGADVLIRVKNGRRLPVCRALSDGSFVSRVGRVDVRAIIARVTITTSGSRRTEIIG